MFFKTIGFQIKVNKALSREFGITLIDIDQVMGEKYGLGIIIDELRNTYKPDSADIAKDLYLVYAANGG